MDSGSVSIRTPGKSTSSMFAAIAVFIAMAMLLVPYAAAQPCNGVWFHQPDFGVPGVDGSISASTVWDPDGSGPQPALLVVGGKFSVAGQTQATNIAAWSGMSWQPLGVGVSGSGPSGDGRVCALITYGNSLVAAGAFTSAGGLPASYVAQWNGVSWQSIGSGLSGQVKALAVYNGDLVVGGAFTAAGGQPASCIARWNGSAWQSLDSGLNGDVRALAVYNGELVAGGTFSSAGGAPATGVARWDGTLWRSLGSGVNRYVYSLAVYNNELVAGGDFQSAGGQTAFSIARWNGAVWQTLGPGIDLHVYALAAYNGQLFVGGDFINVGSQAAQCIARWNGSLWQAVGQIQGGSPPGGPLAVNTLCVFGSALFVGGAFTQAAGQVATSSVLFDGTQWQSMGYGTGGGIGSTGVAAFTAYNGDLVVGGSFFTLGGHSATFLAQQHESSWQQLGTSVDREVYALGTYGPDLIASGPFHNAGGQPAQAIARWNGNSWSPLGGGLNGAALSFGTFGGDLIVGGYFSSADGQTVNQVARWNGTTWLPLGLGVGRAFPLSAIVYALANFNGELVAAGLFSTAGGQPANCIARWNGASWQTLGAGLSRTDAFNASVSSLVVYHGELVAGGYFNLAGGLPASNVAAWNGVAWHALGSGMDGAVSALAAFNDELIAAGGSSNIAHWNGASWAPLGSGTNGQVNALLQYGSDLFVGGYFSTAGGIVDAFLAKWGCDCYANCDTVPSLRS